MHMSAVISKKRQILYILPGFGCNGSPCFALETIDILRQHGYMISVWSRNDGVLRNKFEEMGCDTYILPTFYNEDANIYKKIKMFGLVIVFTVICEREYEFFSSYVPTVWYIHEGKNLKKYLSDAYRFDVFMKARDMWGVSEYARDFILSEYHKKIKVIHNFVNDDYESIHVMDKKNQSNQLIFTLIGSMVERKGFDVLLDAYDSMKPELKGKVRIYFIGEQNYGHEYAEIIHERAKNNPNICFFDEITDKRKLWKMYLDSSVIIVPSRDESCSLVTLEAAMIGRPIIVTENVGAKFVVEGNGWVIANEDANALRDIMEDIVEGKYDLNELGEQSRQNYLKYVSKSKFETEYIRLIQEIARKTTFYWKLRCLQNAWNAKNRKMAPLFPLKLIPKKSKIILYGYGKNGKRWEERIRKNRNYKLVGIVDQNQVSKNICSIHDIKSIKFDIVFITIKNIETCEEVKGLLLHAGVDASKIFCEADI